MSVLRIGLVSDTHGVFDEALASVFEGVDQILHAGDVGHHGGHNELLAKFQRIAPTYCVRGNVDEAAPLSSFPVSRLLTIAGWRILLTHIVGMPPKVATEAQELIQDMQPDIVIFGHSHKAGCERHGGVLYVNPGSAGPARFKLARTVAMLTLPLKTADATPYVKFIPFATKAPPRHAVKLSTPRKRKRRR